MLLTIVSCTRIAPHGTLLTSAVVTAYATFLCFSALASHPDASCNPQAAAVGGSTTECAPRTLAFPGRRCPALSGPNDVARRPGLCSGC